MLTGDKGIGKATFITHILHYYFDKNNYNLTNNMIVKKANYKDLFLNNLYPNISSFFFCTLLFYLFFEVFFSFFRKLYNGKSPFYPDGSHLHMLSFYKITKVFGKEKSNFLNSIIINFSFLILILPGIYFSENPYLSRYWFFILLLIYMVIYFRLYRLTKN